MAVGGITGSAGLSSLLAANPSRGVAATSRAGGNSDGDSEGGRAHGVGKPRGGFFAAALNQTLSQFGIAVPRLAVHSADSGRPSSDGASHSMASATATDPVVALRTFVQDLFAALAGTGSNAATTAPAAASAASGAPASDSDGSGSSGSATSAVSGGGHHHHHGGAPGALENKLQSLLQQLGAGGADASSAPALAALQQGYQGLLGALGATGSNAPSLSDFLTAFAKNLPGASTTGNVVSTQA